MLRAGLDGCSGPEQLIRTRIADRHGVPDGGGPFRKRPGLVQHHVRDGAQSLERLAGAHEDAVVGRLTGAPHDGERRRDADGARIAHYQYAQAGKQGALHVGRTREPERSQSPAQPREERQREHGGRVDPKHPVHEVEEARLEGLRLLDLAGHLLQEALVPGGRHLHQQRPGLIDRAADHLVALGLFLRHRFAGHQRLVDAGPALQHGAVDRHLLAGTNADVVPLLDRLDGHFRLLPVAHDPSGVGLQVQECLDRLCTAGLHDQSQPLRKDVIGEHHDRDGEKRRRGKPRQGRAQPDRAPDQPGKRPHLHEDVLIENAPAKRLTGFLQDRQGQPEDHDQSEAPDDPGHRGRDHAGLLQSEKAPSQHREPGTAAQRNPFARPPQHEIPEGDEAEKDGRREAEGPQCPRSCDQSDRRQTQGNGRKEATAFVGEGRLLLFERLGLARIGDRVSHVAERLHENFRAHGVGIVFDQGLLVGEAHRHRVDARLVPEGFFDRARTEGTVHPADPGAKTAVPVVSGRLVLKQSIFGFLGERRGHGQFRGRLGRCEGPVRSGARRRVPGLLDCLENRLRRGPVRVVAHRRRLRLQVGGGGLHAIEAAEDRLHALDAAAALHVRNVERCLFSLHGRCGCRVIRLRTSPYGL